MPTLLALTLLAQLGTPIQKVGPACPLGYYSQGAYCTPSTGVGRYTEAIPKAGNTCPWGFYRQGDYCSRTNQLHH
jgi:hypothetical protein